MLIDSHCHLDRIDLKPYANDFNRMMDETKACGVAHILCVSINLEAFPIMRSLVNEYPQVSISVGVHPNEKLEQNIAIDTLLSLASDPKVVAIGETGLDYYRTADNLLSKQHQRFRTHVQAALSCNKPLIIHSRQAPKDTLQILQEEQASNVGGVLHCFTEDWDTAKAALDINFYISFSGIVTFPNAAKLREVAKFVPLDRLLIETDSPYLAPVPHRGKSNEPKFVTHVAKCIAEVRNLSPESLITATGENFMRLFNMSLNLQYVMWCILSIFTAINPTPSPAGWFATQEQEAARSFSHKHYEQAAARFSDPYRKGVAYYRAGDFNAAAASFEKVSRSEVMLDARYNLGNARFQLGDLMGAIAAYEAVLKQHPKHEDAAFNLALARSMLPATAPTPEPELTDNKQEQKQQDKPEAKDSKPEQQDKQQEKQEEKQQSGDSNQKQQEKKEEKQQSGDSKQEQQEKQQSGDSKQEQQEKQKSGDSKQEKQQTGDSEQNQENNSSGQNTGKASSAGKEQDQNQQSGAESNQEQTGDSPPKQISDKQDTAEQSSPEQKEQGAAKEPKQNAEEKGEKGDKEQQDQSSGTKSQEQLEQGQGKEKSLQKQQDGSQPDNKKDEGEGGNKPQLETEGKNKLEPETKGDSDSNQDQLNQESGGDQQAKPDTDSGNKPQPDQAGTAEQPPPPSEKKDSGSGQKENNSQSSQRGQRHPNNRNDDLPPDLPPEGQDLTAVPLHALDQVGQAPGSNEPGDDGASALGGNPAAGPGMAILEQMLEQVEGDPAYLMRNAFLLEEAKYKRSRGGVAVEIRPW